MNNYQYILIERKKMQLIFDILSKKYVFSIFLSIFGIKNAFFSHQLQFQLKFKILILSIFVANGGSALTLEGFEKVCTSRGGGGISTKWEEPLPGWVGHIHEPSQMVPVY